MEFQKFKNKNICLTFDETNDNNDYFFTLNVYNKEYLSLN